MAAYHYLKWFSLKYTDIYFPFGKLQKIDSMKSFSELAYLEFNLKNNLMVFMKHCNNDNLRQVTVTHKGK